MSVNSLTHSFLKTVPCVILRFSIFHDFQDFLGTKKKMFPEEKLISTGFQSTWGCACTSVISKAPPLSRSKPFSFSRIQAKLEKPTKKSEFLRGNSGRNFPWWSIAWQRESSPLQVIYLVQNLDIMMRLSGIGAARLCSVSAVGGSCIFVVDVLVGTVT